MKSYDWGNQIEYLKRSIRLYYNDDYIEFLIEKVWKIHSPVHILDFGCGFGHLGLRLLPFLPEGSKYVGIDASAKLIELARGVFQDLEYNVEFFVGDIHTFHFEQKYVMVVCHGVLLHMADPVFILKRMSDCVKEGGKVVAFEPHWISSHASFHFEGIEQSVAIPLGPLQKLFEEDAKSTGKDGNIGLKLPLYLNRLGLHDVECRVSDKVNILDPESNSETAQMLL
ncbi:class I SAM-dependent methyltransferase [Alkalihalobacillus pseudalcaliphilus]|uniref:class I SAM-dependent methyltransferase n=1 Tax=Alkalihalobacillus pseudalcaliphilus TaxID=79884 RepID=UPI000AD292D5|nr:class I SAM-dependent methyltransferase [Alkalihalobacillus pseudalcaliphilus]